MSLSDKYPHIKFKKHWNITLQTAYHLGQCDMLIHAIAQLPLQPKYKRKLLKVSLMKGAAATTAIEGNTLSDEDLKKIQNGQSLPPSKEYQELEVTNILNAFNSIIAEVVQKNRSTLISPDMVKNFNQMVGKGLGKYFDSIPGKYRTDNRVVGVYRTPDYDHVEILVGQLCDWLKTDFDPERGYEYLNTIIKAIVAHVYIEWIHPFGDGNGRTGRLTEFYILLRAGTPVIASHILSNFYNETRTEYYWQFENARKKQDLTDFISYAVLGFRDGLLTTFNTIRENLFSISWQKLIYDTFAEQKSSNKQIMKRRRNLMLNLDINKEYSVEDIALIDPIIAREYAKISQRTLLRDLSEIEKLKLVIRKKRKYKANLQLLAHLIPDKKEINF